MKNAGKACNNRLYRHIRTFEKIVKNYFVILTKYTSHLFLTTIIYFRNHLTYFLGCINYFPASYKCLLTLIFSSIPLSYLNSSLFLSNTGFASCITLLVRCRVDAPLAVVRPSQNPDLRLSRIRLFAKRIVHIYQLYTLTYIRGLTSG